MRRLLFVAICLTVFLAIGLVAGIAYGRERGENPIRARGFGVCSGRPCFRGIVAGTTSIADAIASMERWEGRKVDNLPAWRVLGDQDVVEDLYVSQQSGLTLGDFVAMYGPPCRVWVDIEMRIRTHFYFPNLELLAFAGSFEEERIDLSTAVDEMAFTGENLCGPRFRATQWTGFTHTRCYLDIDTASVMRFTNRIRDLCVNHK